MDNNESITNRLDKTVAALVDNLSKLRSNRAHPGLLDSIMVNCYGSEMPLPQVATVSIMDAKTLTVIVWDKQNASAVEKAIRDSDVGVNPMGSGQNIRVPMPILSEERRRDLVKLVGKEVEKAKIAARKARHDELDYLKSAVKDKSMSEDESKRLEKNLQKLMDDVNTKMESIATDKQKDLMTV